MSEGYTDSPWTVFVQAFHNPDPLEKVKTKFIKFRSILYSAFTTKVKVYLVGYRFFGHL